MLPPLHGFILLIYLTVGFCLTTLTSHLDIEVHHQCIQKCPLQNRSAAGHYSLGCGFECNIVEQCATGCKLWRQALDSSCRNICNGTSEPLTSKELYCVMGCNNAVTSYFTKLRTNLGIPPAPVLVADSLTATSLRLEWTFQEAKPAGLNAFIQWRYEELAATWQYSRNQTWITPDTVLISELQPYTKYRFRVALLMFQSHSEPIVSLPSVVISTLPAGVPASPPSILRAVPVDSTSISVSWEPGPFPHGPLLSYVLTITDNYPQGYSAMKEIAAEKVFYMFRNLQSARNYTLSINMRNGVGSGPPAQILVSTPVEPTVKNTQQPILFLGADHVIIQQAALMLDDPIVLYNSTECIKGMAIHIEKQLLFISDAKRYVYRKSLAPGSKAVAILTPQHINFLPLDLSVDWLNEQLYILGKVVHQDNSFVYQISRCNLDGQGMTVAVAGLRYQPHHIEVDPYNGFLFWAIDEVQRKGLYRLDIADISNGIKHEVIPQLILEDPYLGTFTVDHTNFRLLVCNKTTVNSVSLDGEKISNLRPNIRKSRLQHVVSIALANGKFYWTTGIDVLYEEYHAGFKSYFHNSYPDLTNRKYFKVVVNLPSSQPTPVPINPPTAVQAIFAFTLSKTTWQVPHLLGGQGKGAWQNWSYEIMIKDSNQTTITHNSIVTNSYSVLNLNENMEYVIKVAAYTVSGKGPWSSEFKGKTLRKPRNGHSPYLLWSANEGLLKSDITGENIDSLIHGSTLKDHHIIDTAWYKDLLYLVTNTSKLYWFNMTSHERGQIIDTDSVGSIAVDWIGKKLYWSNPKQQLIIRGNLNGTQQEPLPILTLAKELNIDTVRAYLYWSTGQGIECARLNGADRIVFHSAQIFSAVMGLTLDMDNMYVYWVIRSIEVSTLYRAPMASSSLGGNKPVAEVVSFLQKPTMQGRLCYFSDHLLWLEDNVNATIGDMHGQNTAIINGKSMTGLNKIFVMDSSLQLWDDSYKELDGEVSVVPYPVEISSVTVNGTWQNFNITWKEAQNVNYGDIFYEIKVSNPLKTDSSIITSSPSIQYWRNVKPFTKLTVTVSAYTYWDSSTQITTEIRSPSSTPTEPVDPRVFISHTDIGIVAEFRWNEPFFPNGIILGYKISCWFILHEEVIYMRKDVVLNEEERKFIINNLYEDTKHYFQVLAFTSIGDGKSSEIISFDTSTESPLPKLLIASTDSIILEDIDANETDVLIHSVSPPVEITYNFREDQLFWINNAKELLMLNSTVTNRNIERIHMLNGQAISLTLDWLERSLYFVQLIENAPGSVVYKLDINQLESLRKDAKYYAQIFRTPNNILKLEVSPFTRKLYWIEENNEGKRTFKQSNVDGSEIKTFFSEHRLEQEVEQETCNCPLYPAIEKTFAIDHSTLKIKPELIFIDSITQNVIISDNKGCSCKTIIEGNLVTDLFPFKTLKADFATIYWIHSLTNIVYTYNKNNTDMRSTKYNGLIDISIWGPHIQPYPKIECITPQNHQNMVVTLLSRSSHSLNLQLPEVHRNHGCLNTSLATIEYKVYYMPYFGHDDVQCNENCTKLATFLNTMEIVGLRPFSKYVVSVSLSNFFSRQDNIDPYIGPGVILQTAAGAPSKPENVKAIVLNPTIVEVTWQPPKELNGESVRYEIHWQTEGSVTGIRQKGEQTILMKNQSHFTYKVTDLSPNVTYLIWVRACSHTNDTSNSDMEQIRTYPEPENITLIDCSAYMLNVSWNYSLSVPIQKYFIQYSEITSNTWQNISNNNIEAQEECIFVATIKNLKPKTQYKLRLFLLYTKYPEPYIWPTDSRFTFETLGDKPSPPGVPMIQHVQGKIYEVGWETPESNGASIELYRLEAHGYPNYRNRRSANRSAFYNTGPYIEEQEDEWITYYNGTETHWIISGLSANKLYSFRVSAFNMYGWSDPSEESSQFDLNAAALLAEKHEQLGIILGISIPIMVSITLCVLFCLVYLLRQNGKESKNKQALPLPRGPDVELATLRELPRRENFIHNTNVLYVSAQPTPDELALLPHIRRDQITLTKFLGSGAFGEVFEGRAKNIVNNGEDMKVAVKTLRKGASDQEKTEFLQEAQLMSHFKHEHILQMLGVCLDNDPHFIIMELMEAGDLLTYLRSSRSTNTASPLNLLDLLTICVDVAKGCRYLEEMHFVHRDLACRNCLVSSSNRQSRIVKIGDFGLARDIYKNDYYRKEGEGLLPVRWMAPESLVDGVFTCQSDVWSFGVLMWEIMTFGQQPYPARNNLEVLYFVRGGGRLGKPSNCPKELHQLMLQCWSFIAEDRPTFKYCLEELQSTLGRTPRIPVTAAHEGHYISTVSHGGSWRSEDGATSKERVPFLQTKNNLQKCAVSQNLPTEIPKYLELLYDSDCPPESDGYEVPRSDISTLTRKLSVPNLKFENYSVPHKNCEKSSTLNKTEK